MRVSPILTNNYKGNAFKGVMIQKSKSETDHTWPAYVDTNIYNYYPFNDENYSEIKKVEDAVPKSEQKHNEVAYCQFTDNTFTCKKPLSFTKDEYNQYVAIKAYGEDPIKDKEAKINITMDDFIRIGNEINSIQESEKSDDYSFSFSVKV